jgi:regulator of protease activity HflC (stomatin/prohibitin superfamily)
MLSQFIEYVIRFFQYFLPFTIVPPWAGGPVIRLGKVVGEAGPGICWHLPFNITKVAHVVTVVQTIRPDAQTITTLDGKSVVAAMVMRFTVSDPTAFVVKIMDARAAIDDIAAGTLRLLIKAHTWKELHEEVDIDNELSIKTRALLKPYGIHVQAATLADFGHIRSIRLMLDKREENPTMVLT